jgi:NAD(P)-dependent dehydrogenase (short-subunit alcohol dehydrogenase family)
MSLENRVAVITGATGALGSVLSHDLAEHKVGLALFDRDETKLASLTENLALPNARILSKVVNILDPTETFSAAKETMEKFNKVDILLHVVGGWTGGKSLMDASPADLEFMLNQHIWTSFNVIRAFVPYMITNGWGRIVMVTSPYAARPQVKGGPYSIGKAGQESLVLTLAQELKGTGVTANLIQAKTIDTKREKVASPTHENAFWTTPEELSAAILYLLSSEAATINGAKIPLYGSY